MMRWKYLIPLFIFLFLAGFLFKGLYMDPREVPSALINKPAPEYDLQVLGSDGRVTKKDMLGKVYLMNVWASWCEACRYEHPYFVQLKNQGEKVIMMGYNYRDKPYAAGQWLEAFGNPYDVIVTDPKGATAIDFGVYGAPETFVIDKKGVIRHKVIGAMTEEVWTKTVKPLVDKLQAE